MRELRLYSRAFNRDEKIHYLFSTNARYLSEIASYILFTIPFNDYRINNGQIMIGPKFVNVAGVETEVTLDDLAEACYVADVEYDANSNVTRAVYYFVRRCFDQSGNMFLDVERDLWASSLLKASFGAFHVTRLNRPLNDWELPDFNNSYGDDTPQALDNNIAINKMVVVFKLNMALDGGLFVADVSKSMLLCINLQDLYNLIHEAYVEFDNDNIVDKVIDLISGIHSVLWDNGFDRGASVSQAWLIPMEALGTTYALTNIAAIRTRGLFTKGNVTNITTAKVAAPNAYTKGFNIPSAYEDMTGTELDLDCYIEAGTAHNSMPLRRGGSYDVIYYRFLLDTSGVSVYVEQGTRNKDITSAFELALSLNGASETSLIAQTKFLGKMAASIASVGANLAIGNVGGAGLAAIGGVGTLTEEAVGTNVNRASSGGDAALTYSYSSVQVLCPFAVRIWYITIGVRAILALKGALNDAYITYAMFPLIETMSYFDGDNNPPTPFIVCDYVEVNGLNVEEEKYFKDEFARGIKYKYISTP